MQCLFFLKPNAKAIFKNNVYSSKSPTGPRAYALLPSKPENHPFHDVLKENDIHIMKNVRTANYEHAELEVFEIFFEGHNAFHLYCDYPDSFLFKWLFGRSNRVRIIQCHRIYGSSYNNIFLYNYELTLISTHYAVIENQNLQIIGNLLKSGSKITHKRSKGGTLLHFAAHGNRFYANLVKLALKCGVSIDARNIDGATPLHEAVQCGSLHMVNLLLKLGAQVDAKMKDLSTPLHKGVKKDSMAIWLLVEKGANVNAKTKDGLTPLHIALGLVLKSISTVKYLLRNGADVNAVDVNGATPLLHCHEKWPHFIPLLVGYGADVNIETNNNRTVLLDAVTGVSPDIFDFVLSLNPCKNVLGNRKAFQKALSTNTYSVVYAEFVEKMIQYGFDVDASDANQPGMLFGAISKNRFKIVEKLIDFGAEVNQHYVFEEKNLTPLHLAVQRSNIDIVQLLLDHGADVGAQRDPGVHTPMSDAVESGSIEVVKILAMNGVKVREEANLLHLAAETSPEMLQFLLDEGCDLKRLDNKNRTPLSIALCMHKTGAMEIMVRFGARVDFTKFTVRMARNLAILTAFLDHCFTCLPPMANAAVHEYFPQKVNAAYSSRECCKTLARHLVKMEAANICHARDFVSSHLFQNFSLDFFLSECKAELEVLKIRLVSNTEVTYFDILTGNLTQITCYARNGSFARILESSDVRSEYPIYGSILRCKFRSGSLRRKLLQLGMKVLSFFSPQFSALPYDLKEIVVDHLSNQDLFILRKCLPSK